MAEYLPRSGKHKSVLLIIIFLPTVCEIVSTHHILEEYYIYPHILSTIRYRFCHLRAFKDVYIRVACWNAPVFVVVLYGRNIDYLVHIVERSMIANLSIK